MLRQIRNSLGAKIIVYLGIILICVLTIITFLNFSAQKEILLNRGFKESSDLGDSILTGIRYPMLNGDQDIIQLHFDNFRSLSGIKSVSLLNYQGIIKRSTDRNKVEQRADSHLVVRALIGQEAHGIESWEGGKQKVFTETIPIRNEKQCIICHGSKQDILGVLKVNLDWQPVLDSISSAKNMSIMIAVIGMIVISISVIFLLLKIVIQPIFIVEQGLKRLSEGDLKYTLPVTRTDEIGRVSKMFNQMTKDISNFISREKELRYAEQLKSKEIAESLSLINATLEATADGILVTDKNNNITRYNLKLLDILGLSEDLIKSGSQAVLDSAYKDVEGGDQFIQKMKQIYEQQDMESFDIIKFKNGKIIERASRPQKIGTITVGRVWSFRDITERKRTEEALENKMTELERFNRFVVGREIKMKELKEQIAELKDKALKDKSTK